MRIWHRLRTVLPLLLTTFLSASAAAQGIYSPAGPPQYGAGMPGQSAIGYGGMAPSFLSHPYISPFDNAVERHFSSEGIWYRDAVSHFSREARQLNYEMSVEWLQTRTRNLGGRVGDPNAVWPVQRGLPDAGQVDFTTPIFRFEYPFNMGGVGDIRNQGIRLNGRVNGRDGWNLNVNGTWNGETASIFDGRAEVERYRIPYADALFLEATGGNPNSPLPPNLNTPTLQEITENIILGRRIFDDGDVEEFDGLGSTFDILDATLLILPSLPLQNGVDPTGISQQFDIDYIVSHSVESYGAGAHFESGALYQSHGIQFRGLLGGRYFHVDEGFNFTGTDSGLDYTRPSGGEGVDRIDNDGNFQVDELTEGGGGGDFTQLNLSEQILVRSFVTSDVQSDMAGPEFGISYDLGDKLGLNVTGSSRFGILLNTEKLQLRGDNIGNAFSQLEMFDTTTLDGRTQNFFTDAKQTTHVSPMFEQSFTAQLPLFRRMPVLKDCRHLENANLQVGYTFLFVDEVADPQQSIVWESNPRAGLFPTLDIYRRSFYQNSFRIGVNWEY